MPKPESATFRLHAGLPTLAATATLACVTAFGAAAQESKEVTTQDLNDANNPLNPAITLNLHNFYIPDLGGPFGEDANIFMLRGLIPSMLFGQPNLLRFTLPVITEPSLEQGQVSGWGDLLLFDLAVFEQEGWAFGVGPVLGIPTASEGRFGNEKWTAGVAGGFVVPQDWGLIGGLATYQQSFAGDEHRADIQSFEFQPFTFYNLPNGFYLQSTAAWTFNLENDTWMVPVGLGLGKLWHLTDDIKMNAFIEPQYTIAHEGFAPQLRIFAGVNFSYSLDKFLKK